MVSTGLILASLLLMGGETLELNLSISVTDGIAHLGEPFAVEVEYENSGTAPFYLERPKGIGEDHLNFFVRSANAECSAKPLYYTRPAEGTEWAHFTFVSLLPGERLVTEVVFNDPLAQGLPSLPFPGPGQYRISAHFTSAGQGKVGYAAPVWRGELTTDEHLVEVPAPDPKALMSWRNKLEKCLELSDPSLCDAVEFFRIVSDGASLPTLRELLYRWPDYDRIAEAVFSTGTEEAADLLLEVSRRDDVLEPFKSFYEDLAEQLRRSEVPPCR